MMNRFFGGNYQRPVMPQYGGSALNPYMRPVNGYSGYTPTVVPTPQVTAPVQQNYSAMPQQPQAAPMIPNQTNLIWVESKDEIATYPTGRGWQQWFGDKNEQILYVRDTDANGVTQPIVKLRYEIVDETNSGQSQEVAQGRLDAPGIGAALTQSPVQPQTPVAAPAPEYNGPSREEFDKLNASVEMLVDKLGDLLK